MLEVSERARPALGPDKIATSQPPGVADLRKPSPAPSLAFSPSLARHDHISAPRPASAADKPGVPIRDGHLGAVPLGHLSGVGLDLVAAIKAPNNKPDTGRRGTGERHRCVSRIVRRARI